MVTVSVRRAIGGSDLEQLKDAVERDFLKLDRTGAQRSERGREDGEWFDRTYGGVRK